MQAEEDQVQWAESVSALWQSQLGVSVCAKLLQQLQGLGVWFLVLGRVILLEY